MAEVIFISGIDTDAGKSYATGHLANMLTEQGHKVITQKFIQTGCTGFSDDIRVHRSIMGLSELPEDKDHTTSPIIFRYPASAQLAAAMENATIDLNVIDEATRKLSEKFDVVLIEGAGGLMVPITDTYFTIDYAASRSLPVALVTNSRLGSINHTLLSLEALAARRIPLHSVLYNTYFDADDPIIAADTRAFIKRYIDRMFPGTPVINVPAIDKSHT